MCTSPAEKVFPTGYICNGMMCAHVVVYEIIIAHKAVRLYNVCIIVNLQWMVKIPLSKVDVQSPI